MKQLMTACVLLFAVFLTSPAFAEIKPLDAELSSYPYPFTVSFYEFKGQKQNLRMAFMDVKPKKNANGKNIVLLHGKNFGGAYWDKTIRDLSADGYRVIVPDQIGFGKSTKPENLNYSFQQLATWTDALLKKQGVQKYALVGHSMGGMLATRMALMYPDKVERLALINPIGLEDWKTMAPYTTIDQNYKAELKATPDTIRTYQRDHYFKGEWKPEYESLITVLGGWTRHKDYPRVAWNAALTSDMIFTQPVVYEFKNLTQPTLLAIGTADRTAPGKGAASAEMKEKMGRYDLLGKTIIAQIPKGQLVEFDGVGHLPQVEIYDAYIATLKKFLNPTEMTTETPVVTDTTATEEITAEEAPVVETEPAEETPPPPATTAE